MAAALGLVTWGSASGQDPVQWWNAFTSGSKAPGGAVEAWTEWRVFEWGDILFWSAEASWLLRAGKRVTWGPGYKYQEMRQPGGPFLAERRYLLNDRTRLGQAAGWKTGLRALYEYRDREGAPRSWRGRLRGEARQSLGGSGWDAGVSNGVFFDSAADRYAQNGLQVALFRRLGETAGFPVYHGAQRPPGPALGACPGNGDGRAPGACEADARSEEEAMGIHRRRRATPQTPATPMRPSGSGGVALRTRPSRLPGHAPSGVPIRGALGPRPSPRGRCRGR